MTKYLIPILLCMCFFNIEAQERKSTKSQNVSVIEKEFVIKGISDAPHKIWVYLPPNYHSSKKKYPVIYMHDGQNLFDDKTSFVGEWKIDETLNGLFESSGKGFIVVGVENGGSERINEYTPWPHDKYGGGKGKEYIHFIVNDLKPFIDANYRTKPKQKHTGLIGSSLGGLISYYGGLTYPDVFGKVGALSTSFWFSDKVYELTKKNGNQNNLRLYLLAGGKEGGTMVIDMYKAKKMLLESGFNQHNLISKENKDAKHNEAFWSSEFETVVKWLYKIK